MSESRDPAPIRGGRRLIALVWVAGVVGLYVAVHVFGLYLVR